MPLQCRNQIWQSLVECARKRSSECEPAPVGKVQPRDNLRREELGPGKSSTPVFSYADPAKRSPVAKAKANLQWAEFATDRLPGP